MGWVAVTAGTVIAAYAWVQFRSGHRKDQAPPVAQNTPSFVGTEDLKASESEETFKAPSKTATPTILLQSEEQSSPTSQRPIVQRTNTAPTLSLSQSSLQQPSSDRLMGPPPRPRSSSPPRLAPPTMSAPPRPSNGFVRPPPSAAASLRVPQTQVLSNASLAPSKAGVPKNTSKQIILKPGYSPLDWATLTSDPSSNLRGKDAPRDLAKITPSQLKRQTGRKGKDAWTSFQGKVYNISAYLPFHPGGQAEIMKGAGRDSGRLFMENHPWVNWDGMLAECLVGILVSETEFNARSENSGGLDEMD